MLCTGRPYVFGGIQRSNKREQVIGHLHRPPEASVHSPQPLGVFCTDKTILGELREASGQTQENRERLEIVRGDGGCS